LTDNGLLQLGVQDAAERQALLTARKNFQQQQEQQQAQQQQQSMLDDGTQHTMVLPTPSAPAGAGAGHSVQAAARSNTADSLQDTEGNVEGSKKSGVRYVAGSCCLAEVA
jgi:transcription initiation factor TFIID subunit TAF12